MEQNCKTVRRALWDHAAWDHAAWDHTADSATEGDVRGAHPHPEDYPHSVDMHLKACRDCERHRAEVQSLRAGLRHLPLKHVPPLLATRVRVIASRERSRQLARRDFSAWMTEQTSRLKLFFDNLLKPFAVPAAGGILTSFLCFGVIVNTLHVVPDWRDDIPIGISTEIAIDELSPFCFGGRDVMVQLTVDSGGHVTDFEPQERNTSPEEWREIGNLVLYSTFTPATRLGRPVSSKRFFVIRHISIKG